MTLSKQDKDEEDQWRVEDDLRAVVHAIEIIKDKKRFDKVKSLAKERKDELETIEDIEYLKQIGLKD